MKVLILTGKFGMGHNSVAKAIAEEFEDADKNNEIVILDILEYLFPLVHQFLYKGFEMMIDKCHGVYNMMYRLSARIEVDVTPLGSRIYRKMDEFITENKPDFIICTIPLSARIISQYKEKKGLTIPLITCITDISKHKEWIAPYIDFYFAPTKDIKKHLVSNGVNEENIFVTGIPVRRNFKNIKENQKTNDRKNVLIMGGGLGLLPDIDKLILSLKTIDNADITVITGKNKNAFNYLKENFEGIEVLGYTENVNEYMEKADLIITKAGGITLFEAIYSGTPMFVINPFLEQEKRNAEFIEDRKIGKVVWDKSFDYSKELVELLKTEKDLDRMHMNMVNAKEEIIEKQPSMIINELHKVEVA